MVSSATGHSQAICTSSQSSLQLLIIPHRPSLTVQPSHMTEGLNSLMVSESSYFKVILACLIFPMISSVCISPSWCGFLLVSSGCMLPDPSVYLASSSPPVPPIYLVYICCNRLLRVHIFTCHPFH